MQQKPLEIRQQFANYSFVMCVLVVTFLSSGCADRPSTIDAVPQRPFEGVKLRIAVSDSADVPLLRDLAKSWAIRNNTSVVISESPDDTQADLRLIKPFELPEFAEKGLLAEVPGELQIPTNSYRWDDIFIVNSSRMCVWKSKTFALPIIGEAIVFAYRNDVFDGRGNQPNSPPRTWSDIAIKAAAASGKALATWPVLDESKEALFQSLGASLDRPAINRIPSGAMVRDEFFSFHFETTSGKSRLAGQSFVEAGKIMASLTPLMTPGADPAVSFNKHDATMGFLTLKDLSRIDSKLIGKIGILPLPGTSFTISENGEKLPTPSGNVNRVPFLGWGGRLGVVSKNCARPDAAWDFCVDAGMPDRQALDLISSTEWGAGPFRASQIDTRVRPRWLAYGLSTAETDQLTGSLRENLGIGTQNFRTSLRTPNEREFRLALRPRLAAIINGTSPPEKALREVDTEWTTIIGKLPPAQWKEWLRQSLGL